MNLYFRVAPVDQMSLLRYPVVQNTQTCEVWIRARVTIWCPVTDTFHMHTHAQRHRVFIKHCPSADQPIALGTHHWRVPHTDRCEGTTHTVKIDLKDLTPYMETITPAEPPSIDTPSIIDVKNNY